MQGTKMENDKLKVYAESSIFSYLTGHPVKDKLVMFRKMLTHVWWDNEKPKCAVFVSQHVVDEAGDGDPKEAAKRLELVRDIPQVDGLNAIVLDLAQKLIDGFAVPATEGTDALHIATAAYHGMDVLLTWNCKHMANPYTLPKTRRIIEAAGFKCPNVTTPERFMEDQEDE